MKKTLVVLLAVLMVFSILATACGSEPESVASDVTASAEPSGSAAPDSTAAVGGADDSWAKIEAKGEIIVGLDDSFPPMGFREDGELVGYDIDLAKAVGEELGVEIVLQPIEWKNKELELNNGNIDVIWNGFTITEERKENLLMSDPYMKNAQVIVVTNESPVQTLADLNGKKVAVQDGSSAQEAIEENAEFASSIEQLDFKENVTALMDLSIGQVDAVAVDLVVANYYLGKEPNKYRILDEQLAPEEYGIGFRKGEVAFHDKVEEALDALEANGTLQTINEKWFGSN